MADPTRSAFGASHAWLTSPLFNPPPSLYHLPPVYPLAMQLFPFSSAPSIHQVSQSASEEASLLDSAISSPGGTVSSDGVPPLPTFGVKKVRLVLPPTSTEKEEQIETPAMRLKARPKRPNMHAVHSEPYPEDDEDDEDYIAPKTASNTSTRKQREKTRNGPLPSFGGCSHFPTNAYPVLGTCLSPIHSPFLVVHFLFWNIPAKMAL